jgi:hypothetical protein
MQEMMETQISSLASMMDAKRDTNLREMKSEIKTIWEKTDSHDEKLMAIMKASKEQITAKMDA